MSVVYVCVCESIVMLCLGVYRHVVVSVVCECVLGCVCVYKSMWV